MKMAESPVTVHTHTHTQYLYKMGTMYEIPLFIMEFAYSTISILLQKKENTRENSLGKIGFDFDAIKKENINRKEVGYSYVEICS